VPPAYVKPSVKRQKNDTTDAEAICEAVTRPNMRFVPTKTVEEQSCLMPHAARHLFISQETAVINSIRAYRAEFGIVAPVGRAGASNNCWKSSTRRPIFGISPHRPPTARVRSRHPSRWPSSAFAFMGTEWNYYLHSQWARWTAKHAPKRRSWIEVTCLSTRLSVQANGVSDAPRMRLHACCGKIAGFTSAAIVEGVRSFFTVAIATAARATPAITSTK
jgi:hypothetical protein